MLTKQGCYTHSQDDKSQSRMMFLRVFQQCRAPVIAVICKRELGADEEDAAVEEEDAAVVAHATMNHRHAHVAHLCIYSIHI